MAPDAAYWEASEACVECGGTDYSEGYSPRTLIFCDCCLDRGVHVECWHKRSGEQLTEERLASPAFQWCCGEGCCRVSERMVELTGVKRPLTDPAEGSEYTVELVRWSQRVGSEKKKVDAAKNIFNSAFAPLKMGNGRNLIDMVCEAFETPDDEVQASGGGGGHEEEDRPENFNFSSFRVLLLRKRGTVVSAATVRAFGSRFCEVPFVATKEGYRRDGHCRRLMQELESMLLGMGVEWVIVPAMKGVLTMWTSHFGYSQLSPGEVEVLEERIVMPDPSSAVLVRKQVQALDTKKARAAPVKIGRSVRFGNISYAESEVDEEGSSEGEGGGGRLKKGGRGGKRRRRSTQKNPDSEDEYAASEEEEEEEEGEDSDDGLVDEAEAEAEEGAGGEEDEAGLCASCATRRSESWFSNAAGESLCVSCTEAEGLPQLCQTCGEAGASKRRKTGLMECNPCSSYRSRHKGETRPAHLWPKNKKRGGSKGGEQAGTQATPRPTTPASRAGAGRGPAAPAACRAATGAAPRAPQHARELQATRASLRAISELALTRREVQAQAAMVAMAEAGHTLLLELTVANELGGQLLHLVRAADQQQAEMQHAYEQRLQGATADKQQAEGLFVQRQDSFESAARAAQEATEQVAVLRAQLAASEAALAAGRAAATEQAAELAALRAQVAAHAQQVQQAAGMQAEPSAAQGHAAVDTAGAAATAAAAQRATVGAVAGAAVGERSGGDQPSGEAEGHGTAERGDEPQLGFPSEVADESAEGEAEAVAAVATAAATVAASPSVPGGPTGPAHVWTGPSPAASAGGAASGAAQAPAQRRRLTSGRASGGGGRTSGRRRVLRSRPAPSGGDAAGAASGAADASAAAVSRQQGLQYMQCPGLAAADISLPLGHHEQQQQQQQQAAGSGGSWGPGLFGMLAGGSSCSADGVAVGDSCQLPAGAAGGPRTSPTLSLEGVAPAAASAVNSGSGQPGGSQASGAAAPGLGGGGVARQAQQAQQAQRAGGSTPWSLPGAGLFPSSPGAPGSHEAEAGGAEAATSRLAALHLGELHAAPAAAGAGARGVEAAGAAAGAALAERGAPAAATAEQAASPAVADGSAAAAMQVAADIAQCLSD